MKEIIIETAKRKRRLPKVLNTPDLPLDAPTYEDFLKQLDQPQPSDSNEQQPIPPT